MAPPFFCVAKRKKGDKGKKERVSKQKLSKGCHLGQNIIVLAILKRLEFENFSSRPTMMADNTFQCFMAHPFWNPFRWPCSVGKLSNMEGADVAFGQKQPQEVFCKKVILTVLKNSQENNRKTPAPESHF